MYMCVCVFVPLCVSLFVCLFVCLCEGVRETNVLMYLKNKLGKQPSILLKYYL